MAVTKEILVMPIGTGGGDIGIDMFNRWRMRLMTYPQAARALAGRIRWVFVDTNKDKLGRIAAELGDEAETLRMGERACKGGSGAESMEMAQAAFAESSQQLLDVVGTCNLFMPIATLGGRTGLNTIYPLSKAAWENNILTKPTTIYPAMERGYETTPRQLAAAAQVIDSFDADGIRIFNVLNEAAYSDEVLDMDMDDVFRLLNEPLARSLEGVLGLTADPEAVDRNYLRGNIIVGPGRYFAGSAEIPATIEQSRVQATLKAAVTKAAANTMFQFRGCPGGVVVLLWGRFTPRELPFIIKTAVEHFDNLAAAESKDGKKAEPPEFNWARFKNAPNGTPRSITILAGERLEEKPKKDVPQFKWTDLSEGVAGRESLPVEVALPAITAASEPRNEGGDVLPFPTAAPEDVPQGDVVISGCLVRGKKVQLHIISKGYAAQWDEWNSLDEGQRETLRLAIEREATQSQKNPNALRIEGFVVLDRPNSKR